MVQASTHSFGNIFKIVLMVLCSLLLIGLIVAVVSIFPTPMFGVFVLLGFSLALLPILFRRR